jgi:hypothetical protein
VPGPNNNRRDQRESAQRTGAALEWMQEAFSIARERRLPALVIGVQANFWSGNTAYQPFKTVLANEAKHYKGRVLVVHGDTHWYRFDRPLVDPRSGNRIENVTRLEVFGSPFVNWVHVTVTIENGQASFSTIPGSDLNRR